MAQTITITINLADLKTAASAEIWKWGQVNKDNDNYQRIYHMQHSDGDNVDKTLLTLYVKQRAERIAEFVSEYLIRLDYQNDIHVPIEQDPSPLLPPQREHPLQYIEYELMLPCGWNNLTYNSLVRHFTDYVINGAVADWFSNIGEKQGAVYEQKSTGESTAIIRNIYKKDMIV
jgi:hypothetical protein